MPFGDVIQYFRDATSINIWVNWGALKEAGVDRTFKVSLRLGRIQASQALKLVLQEVGGGKVLIGYRALDEVLIIATPEFLDGGDVVRVYNVRDIIIAAAEFITDLSARFRTATIRFLIPALHFPAAEACSVRRRALPCQRMTIPI